MYIDISSFFVDFVELLLVLRPYIYVYFGFMSIVCNEGGFGQCCI